MELDVALDHMFITVTTFCKKSLFLDKKESFWSCKAFGEESEIGRNLSLCVNGTIYVFHLGHFQLLILVPLAAAISSLGLQCCDIILRKNAD